MSKLKNHLLNFALFSGSVFVAVVFIEIVIRIFFNTMVLFPRYHAVAEYNGYKIRRLLPNTNFWHTSVDGSWKFEINGQGFRNSADFSYEKPPGVIRVLLLGDSHTEGFEVRQEYTYASVIEKYLSKNGIKSQVINTGVSGFGNAEELVFFEQEGLKYHPDYVVLGFYANDYSDNIKADLFRLDENGKLVLHKKEHLPGMRILSVINKFPAIGWLSENSYFYSLFMNSAWNYAKRMLLESKRNDFQETSMTTRLNSPPN